MKIAIIHDLLVKLGGAEKVVQKLLEMYPQADLFTLMYDEEKAGKVFPKEKIKYIPNITQNIYKLFGNQRFCLPFMSRATETIDLSQYDVVIASHSAFVHGVLTKPETKFIVYYHTPARYMWDRTNEYKKEIGWNKGVKLFILNWMLTKLRIWDYQASQRHDITIANSLNVAKRLKKYYKLDVKVIYPNVEVDRFKTPSILPTFPKGEGNIKLPTQYYIIISALTEFKKIDVSIQAFNKMNDKNLVIVGTGNFRESLEKISKENIYFTGPQYGDELVFLLQNSNGLIFSGEEDFGIVPIEAFGAGKPVFAYRGGGLAETMVEGITGEFFEDKNGDDFVKKFKIFDENVRCGKYNTEKIQEVAEKYSENEFERQMREIVGM